MMCRLVLNRSTSQKWTESQRITWLTDMINISIESFKLLLNEINQIENKNSFVIISEDALLSKDASNEEMASQDHHLIIHLWDMTQKTLVY